ncbi:hypothetical protein MTR_1g103610 [Medicago truncatula]|uniref:Uncharacterized protein n=1 Tax=Medicago truncatula TaxID=3880 RepID=A0A072VR47_MEDTR|nr:hypothetical protein MTR_1g103610 [Medicago truncatula]
MNVPPWRKRDYMLAKWISPSAARSKQVSDAVATHFAGGDSYGEDKDDKSSVAVTGGETEDW